MNNFIVMKWMKVVYMNIRFYNCKDCLSSIASYNTVIWILYETHQSFNSTNNQVLLMCLRYIPRFYYDMT